MARSWQYPRWRRILMQCVMWLVLAGAIASAALINHELRKRQRVALGAPQTLDRMRISLPGGWIKASDPEDQGVLVHLSEPGDGPAGRQLLVLSRRTEGFIPPQDCLSRLDGGAFKGASDEPQLLDIGGYPGLLLRRRVSVGEGVEASVIQACVSFPWRQVVVIHLEGLAEDEDVNLVRRIAGSITLIDRPAPHEAATLHFSQMTIAVPTGWRLAPESDPNRSARELLFTPEKRWISAEIIPCYIQDARPGAIKALAAANDPDWMDAIVTQSRNQWRLDLPAQRKESLVQARILSSENGRGLIVIFRAQQADLPRIDEAWHTMTQSLHFDTANDWTQLLNQGAASMTALAQRSAAILAGREDQWWLWYRSGPAPYMGWMNLQWLSAATNSGATPSPWRAVWETRWREADGSVIRSQSAIEGAGAPAGDYVHKMDQSRSTDETRNFVPLEQQSMWVHDGEIDWTTSSGRSKEAVPPQFIGGGWFPILLSEADPRPMVVKTESLLFQYGSARLLDVIVHPATAAQGGGRQFVIQVNGSGDLSRWSYGPEGDLQSVDCARGLRLLAAGPQDLRLDFHDDPRLAP
jgi:hypothetical protein